MTQGLLANFLLCPEKARLATVEGLTQVRTGGALAFGSIIHDILDVVYSHAMRKREAKDWYAFTTSVLGIALAEREKKDREVLNEVKGGDIEALNLLEENYGAAEGLLPGYLKKWASDFEHVEWLGLEEMFDIPYTLDMPGWYTVSYNHEGTDYVEYVTAKDEEQALNLVSAFQGKRMSVDSYAVPGILMRLRGKRDGRFRSKKSGQVWLFETKTKGRINEDSIMDRLNFDLQTMLYLWTMWKEFDVFPGGVTYNILRKPQLKMKKGENLKQFVARIAKDIEDRPDFYFMRYQSSITQQDLKKWEAEFKVQLRRLFLWSRGDENYKNSSACSMGGVNCQFLSVCSRNDRTHFTRKVTPFPELVGAEIEEL